MPYIKIYKQTPPLSLAQGKVKDYVWQSYSKHGLLTCFAALQIFGKTQIQGITASGWRAQESALFTWSPGASDTYPALKNSSYQLLKVEENIHLKWL